MYEKQKVVRAKATCRRVESYSWKAIVSPQKENFRQGPHESDDSGVGEEL